MKNKLKEAIESGEILRIRYFGGSSPGSEREISPVSIFDDNVRALCIETGTVKTFCISKMEVAIPGEPSKLSIKQSFNPPELIDIYEIANYLSESLEALDWFVQYTDTSLTLHTTFKNGKIKKTPVISLCFEEFEYIFPELDINSPDVDWDNFIPYIVDGDSPEEAEKVKRERPWVVRAKNKNTATYGYSKKAMVRLMEWADEFSPSNKI